MHQFQRNKRHCKSECDYLCDLCELCADNFFSKLFLQAICIKIANDYFKFKYNIMALLPYLMGCVERPRAMGLVDDLLDLDRPIIQLRRYLRPFRSLASQVASQELRDVGSTIKTDSDKFQVCLDVQHFDPEEISVKTASGFVEVEGRHEERKDEHGYVSRQFKRRYLLPEDCNPDTVESKLSSDGVLTIIAPKSSGVKGERAILITHTGPVRRKAQEEEEVANGEAEEEVNSPQKRRRR